MLVTAEGRAELRVNDGGNANAWMDVALEGLPTGSAKVNRFGYGSEVEARAGELYVLRTAAKPVTHLGLGDRRRADVLRIVWTNGIPQSVVHPAARTLLTEVQQLKGSCPFLYAFDGERWRFVTGRARQEPHRSPSTTACARPRPTRASGWSCAGARLAASREAPASTSPKSSGDGVLRHGGVARWTIRRGRDRVERADGAPVPGETALHSGAPRNAPRDRRARARPDGGDRRGRTASYLGGFDPTRYQGIVARTTSSSCRTPAPRGCVMLYLTGWIFTPTRR